MGIDFSDDISGELTINVGKMSYDCDKGGNSALIFDTLLQIIWMKTKEA